MRHRAGYSVPSGRPCSRSLGSRYGSSGDGPSCPPHDVRLAFGVFVVHFVFNLGRSAVFFGMQEIGRGLAVIGLLWVLIVATMWAFDRVDRRAALLLVPYLSWVCFAAYLNYRFWVLN